MRLNKSDLLRALLCAAAIPSFAAAQTTAPTQTAKSTQTVPEVVVTSERRTSSLQRTAAAVTVRTGTELLTQGKFTTKDILEDVPGVVAVDNNSLNVGGADVQGNNITIRGITPGSTASGGPSGISATPPTAVYVDGVYEGVGSNYDIDRVEVLRGPQGTLYGRSATSGVVAFHTRNPTMDKYSGDASAEFGSYELQHYEGGVNLPLTSTLAARIAADYYDQNQGFFGQAISGKRQREDARVKLLWQPTSDLSVLAGYAYESENAYSGGNVTTADGPGNTPPNNAGTTPLVLTTTSSPLSPGHKEQRQYWAEINWNVGFATLTYLPAYRTWQQNDDKLQSPSFIGTGVPLVQLINTPTDTFQTHEFRIASNSDSSLHWIAGVFYYDNTLHNTNFNSLHQLNGTLTPLSSTEDWKQTQNIGYFAESTYSPISTLRLTLGARYDDTAITSSENYFNNGWALCGTPIAPLQYGASAASCTGVGQSSAPQPAASSAYLHNVKVTFYNFTYKARAEYDLTPMNMLYGTVSSAFRPGDVGINNGAPNVLAAEKLTAIEFGSKNRFLDNRLQVNIAGYYYIYDGFQTTYTLNTGKPGDYANQLNAISTTVPARNLGFELETLYRPTSHDQIGLNYSYVQSQWADKPAAFAAAQPETYRAMIPHTVTANYRHTFDLSGGSTIVAAIDGKYQAAHLGANLNYSLLTDRCIATNDCYSNWESYVQQGAQAVGNIQLTWTSANRAYSVTGYVRNFTNAVYATYMVGSTPFNVNFTDPRVFGVVLSGRF
jgi:outer membrane receptor protein involved in Fe transport